MSFALESTSPYKAYVTREPFLFYEMRTTARVLSEGASDKEAAAKITTENLFQYPTEICMPEEPATQGMKLMV